MANRAYLFCSDCDPDDPFTWPNLDRNNQPYYDSRHNIPISWFFFFKPGQVKLVDVFSANEYLKNVGYWQEPKFIAGKLEALEVFRQNEQILAQIVGPGLYSEAFSHFLSSLSRMQGRSLCMDPQEIAQNDEADFEPLRQILRLIDNKDVSTEDIKEAASRFSRTSYGDQDDVASDVLGCTYW